MPKKKQQDRRVTLNPEHYAWLVEQATARGTNTSVILDTIFRILDFHENLEMDRCLSVYYPKLTEYDKNHKPIYYHQIQIHKRLTRGHYDKIIQQCPEIFPQVDPNT